MKFAYEAIRNRPVSKPGPKKKKRSKIQVPEEKHCRRCFRTTQTECWRHAESRIIKFEYGGSVMGGKIPDNQTAWLCMNCDSIMSQPLPKDASQRDLKKHAIEWRRLIELSHPD